MTKEMVFKFSTSPSPSSSSETTESSSPASDSDLSLILQDSRENTCRKRKLAKEKVLRMIQDLRETEVETVTTMEDISNENLAKIFSEMGCLVCNKIPSPFKRYLCADGHLVCASCGEERFIKHGAKCMIETSEQMTEKQTETDVDSLAPKVSSSSTMPLPAVLTPSYWKNEEQSDHFPLCQQKLKLYPADPIYTSK